MIHARLTFAPLAVTALALVLALALAGSAAAAASRLTIRGAGFGHGVGLSQYGAYGFALKRTGYRAILGHYYTGTAIGSADAEREVRVLLQSNRGAATFTRATRAGGRRLTASRVYGARRRGSNQVDLLSASGRRIATYPAPLRVTGSRPLVLRGPAGNGRSSGAYRGALEFRPGLFGGVNAINAIGLDDYVQGVVPVESPSSWPAEALKAQAVAARTYAITTTKEGAGFDHYPDTRSQVYGGVGVEKASTTSATRATRGEVVTYAGKPVVTYFFSTSGGRTEDVENTSLGAAPKPWLKSVEDPYDNVSPRHRWGPIRLGLGAAASRLSGLVKGSFRGIDVTRRGRSPRIVTADVVGTGGRTRVSGATLRARLGLFDTWAYFTSISTGREPSAQPPTEPAAKAPTVPEPSGGGATGGVSPAAVVALRQARATLAGRVFPARAGARLIVDVRRDGRWRSVRSATVGRDGRYRIGIAERGTYRVRTGSASGPAVRVR